MSSFRKNLHDNQSILDKLAFIISNQTIFKIGSTYWHWNRTFMCLGQCLVCTWSTWSSTTQSIAKMWCKGFRQKPDRGRMKMTLKRVMAFFNVTIVIKDGLQSKYRQCLKKAKQCWELIKYNFYCLRWPNWFIRTLKATWYVSKFS